MAVAGGNGYGDQVDQVTAPGGLIIEDSGAIIVSEMDNRRVTRWLPGASSGTTIACGNGVGSQANQCTPWGIAMDAAGSLYVSDSHNHRILRFSPGETDGVTVAGGLGAGGAADQLYFPAGIAVDEENNVFVADQYNHRVQRWAPGATVGVTVAGGMGAGGSADQLHWPTGVALDGSGNLFIADRYNDRIQLWTPGATTGITVAGGAGYGGAADQFKEPISVTVGTSGDLFVADFYGARVQRWASRLPGPPTNVAINPSLNSADVTFSTPTHDGGSPVTAYTARCVSPNGGVTGSASGATSPITVTGLTTSKSYSCRIVASNILGAGQPTTSASFIPSTQPGTPSDVSATRGNGSASVTFATPASDGGRPITAYSVSCSSTDGGTTGSGAGASSPITVSGLTNGKTYTCTATATNAVGTGTPSAASNSFVPATVPDLATAVVATRGNGQVSVAFSGPTNTGGIALTGYRVSCASGDGGVSGSESGGSSPIVVVGLTNGKSYTCRVRAENAVGFGSWSVSSATVVPGTPPGVPGVGTIALVGRTATLPVSVVPADGGSTILGYQAQCTSTNGGTLRQNLVTGPGPVAVALLDAGKSYQCQVRAVNGVGAGGWSALSNVVTVANVPGVPSGVAAVSLFTTAATGGLRVSFTAPASNGGSAITGYDLQCSSNGGVSWTAPVSGVGSPTNVGGLTTGVAYGCRVRAKNLVGPGGWSTVSSPVAVGSPAAPTVTAVTTGFTTGVLGATVGQLQVTFTAGANNGSAITGYTARCTQVGTTTVITGIAGGAATTVTVGSVKVGSGYVCRVTATNGRGTGPAGNPPVSPAALAPANDGRVFVGSPGRATVTGVTASGTGRVKVAFALPGSNNGAAITSFMARCVSTNGGLTREVAAADPNINYNVLNLTVGKTYRCYVAATNSRGQGVWSLPSLAIVVT